MAENGAVWHALNYPLAWALHTIDAAVGLDEFKRNAMATHAELFPSQANGIWTGSDWSTSTLAKAGVGLRALLGTLKRIKEERKVAFGSPSDPLDAYVLDTHLTAEGFATSVVVKRGLLRKRAAVAAGERSG